MGEGSPAYDVEPAEESQGLHFLAPRQLHRAQDPRLPDYREEPNGLFNNKNKVEGAQVSGHPGLHG